KVDITGNGNVVSATSKNGWSIKKMGFKNDTTNEAEAYNVFTAAVGQSSAYVGFDGLPTGFDDDGLAAFVGIEVNNGFAFTDVFPGMTPDFILQDLQAQLANQGIGAQLLDPSNPLYAHIVEPGSTFPILLMDPMTANFFAVYTFDAGMSMAEGGLIDSDLLIPNNPNLTFNGLNHTPVGSTNLSKSNGQLTVSNIGSSGMDGVSIDLGESDGFRLDWAPLDPLLDGFFIHSSGLVAGTPNQSLGEVLIFPSPSGYQFTCDYLPLGVTSLRVEVWNGDAIVQVFPGISGAQFIFDAPVPASGCGKLIPDNNLLCYVIDFPGTQTLDLPGLGQLAGDQIRVLAENGSGTVEQINQVEIIGLAPSLPASLVLNSSEVGFDHQHFQGLSEVQLAVSTGQLVVSNIGSSGQDGVSIDLGESTKGRLGFTNIQTGNGDLIFHFEGSNNGSPKNWGGIIFRDTDSDKTIEYFNPNPSAKVSVELFQGGELKDLVVPTFPILIPVNDFSPTIEFDFPEEDTYMFVLELDTDNPPFPLLSDELVDEIRIKVEEPLINPVLLKTILIGLNAVAPAGITFTEVDFNGIDEGKALNAFTCILNCINTYSGNLDEMELCIQDCFQTYSTTDRPLLRFVDPNGDFEEAPHLGEIKPVPPGTPELPMDFGYFDPLSGLYLPPQVPFSGSTLEVLPFDQIPLDPGPPPTLPWIPVPDPTDSGLFFSGNINPGLAAGAEGLLIRGTSTDLSGQVFDAFGVILIDDGSLINPPAPALSLDPLVVREYD
ncbi:MAG: hypothetical protein AAFV80_19965, partial [Bacteroidota bacterium]